MDQHVLGNENAQPTQHQSAVQMDQGRSGANVGESAKPELDEAKNDKNRDNNGIANEKALIRHI
ncbi:MAG: hypothetical protein ABIO43_11250, partial [Sphingomicrobium sp.]